MKLDWLGKLQHLLQTIAFCLVIVAINAIFRPERPYAPMVAYSLCIGILTWAMIDLGRHLLPSARETGWPTGASGLLLVGGSILLGFAGGNLLGDALSRSLQLYGSALPPDDLDRELRNSLVISIIAGLVGSYYFYSRSKGAYLERQMAEAQRHAGEARLKLLETQLEPHMLFNTLANLRALIGVDPQRAQQMLDHIIAYLRSTLDASRATTHPLRAEFDRLRDYLELMAIRMGPRLGYTLELPPELAEHAVPTLLLQPLVENSIQHGLEPKVQGGRIEVRARRDGAALVLDVTDTGVGPGEGTHGSGFGLAQVRERLRTLHGDAAHLTLQSAQPEGTHVSIRLPA
ncbi:MAG TPA: histidine kinase [Ramlibacter sp.]|jgi:signal transduction histidine kinase|uniref:sensor histidine kinase n=1 Tax=Ramlibacter sp. TaxID=1917967 RepID=UPI002D534570|nr:histidine kinase [Ramlibacter sp.]HZY19629.1 histidine kinase [Ramlibacter sp.]